MDTVGLRLLKYLNRFIAYSFYPIALKIGRMVLDISLPNRYEQDCKVQGKDVRISEFFADVICKCSLVSEMSQEYLSPRSDRWPQRSVGAAFLYKPRVDTSAFIQQEMGLALKQRILILKIFDMASK